MKKSALYLPTLVFMLGCQSLQPEQSTDTKTATPHRTLLTQNAVSSSKTPQPLHKRVSFSQGYQHSLQNSHTLAAQQAGLRAKQLQRDALDSLRQPMVFITGSAGRYNVERDISTAQLKQRLAGYGKGLSQSIAGIAAQLPPGLSTIIGGLPDPSAAINKIPSQIHLARQENFHKASVAAMMPIYTGGRISAIQSLAQGSVDEQVGELQESTEQVFTTLVQRYFGVLLAKQAVSVRYQALKAVRAHAHAAKRMLDVGLISKAENMQGTAALASAQFELQKAKDQQKIAQRALDSLLQSSGTLPQTRLFVNHSPLKPLEYFQHKALKHHPAFAKIKAKGMQAKAMKKLSDANWKPNVAAFGSHELTGGTDDWVVGINARWTLNSPVDRSKLQQSAQATVEQVQAVEQQALNDIALLVEKYWLAVNDARAQFTSLGKEQTLARQIVTLRSAGFKEGLNTIIELNDAEAQLGKIRTERAHAAYQYVTALANLLAATGEQQTFDQYARRASTHIGRVQ